MNRRYLAIGAAVVLAAVIGLYLALPSGEPSREPPSDPHSPAPAEHRSAAEPEAGKPRKSRNTHGDLPAPGSATLEHPAGETRIRDHRTDAGAQPEEPPPSRPPEGRRIASQITADLSQQIRPVLRQCTASLPAGSLTEKARAEGEIIIAIKDRQATVTGATLQLRGVAESVVDDVKQCLTQRAVGLTAPAGNEAELDSYTITVSMALP